MAHDNDSTIPSLGDNPAVGGLARRLFVWVCCTTVALFLLVAAAVWWVSGDIVNGVLGGLFTTLWGGPGFGLMFGAAYQSVKEEDAAKANAQPVPVAEAPSRALRGAVSKAASADRHAAA